MCHLLPRFWRTSWTFLAGSIPFGSGVNLVWKLEDHWSGFKNWGVVSPKSSTDGDTYNVAQDLGYHPQNFYLICIHKSSISEKVTTLERVFISYSCISCILGLEDIIFHGGPRPPSLNLGVVSPQDWRLCPWINPFRALALIIMRWCIVFFNSHRVIVYCSNACLYINGN